MDAAIGRLLARYFPGGLSGQQPTKRQWKNTPTLLAISMAIAMRR
jgi:hypothetical protein